MLKPEIETCTLTNILLIFWVQSSADKPRTEGPSTLVTAADTALFMSGYPAFYIVALPLKNHKWLLGVVRNKAQNNF